MELDFFDADAVIGREISEEESTAPTVDDLLADMARSGIANSLVTNTRISLSVVPWGNEDLAGDVAGHDSLHPLFGIHAVEERGEGPAAARVDALIRQGAAGVSLWPNREGWDFAPWQCPDLFEALSERNLPAFMQHDHAMPQQVFDVLTAFPGLTLVLQRVHYGSTRKILGLMRACPNLYITTSPGWVGNRVLEQFDRYIGSERTLFGTGLFVHDSLPAMAQVIYAELPDQKRQLIASGNVRRLLEAIR